MTPPPFAPPSIAPEALPAALQREGFAVLDASAVGAWAGCDAGALAALVPSWSQLPPDEHLKDGGRYRRRRHAAFVAHDAQLEQVAHRPHWQPLEYNALHGGMERWFAPVEPAVAEAAGWRRLLLALSGTADAWAAEKANVAPPDQPEQLVAQPWFMEAHQFRIDTTDGIGRPTPEGAHRDGVDLVAVFLIGRHAIKGGETRVFQADGPGGQRFTLTEPWSLLLLDDARVIHESTPIQPAQPGSVGWRDTLVLTARAGGFQGPSGVRAA